MIHGICLVSLLSQGLTNQGVNISSGKIKDVLTQGLVDSDTRLVLVNAIYLKCDWRTQFQKNSTRDAEFRLSPVTVSPCCVMVCILISFCRALQIIG